MHVKMQGIEKSFGANKVLHDVEFEILPGEVHALMGENGAGKSTTMNVLTGLHPKDAGTITVDGEEKSFKNPKEAEAFGITFIHQELHIWHDMTVLENLFIGKEVTKGFIVDNKKMEELANAQFEKLGITIPLHMRAGDLSVGEQQMIEIAKALMTSGKIIIMDEPTAALTERESEKLFEVIDSLRSDGVAIVYISHRMEEIFRICDRITVLRDGRHISTAKTEDTSFDQLVKDMVGRELTDRFPKREPKLGEVILEVKGLESVGKFKDVSFSVKSGEILAFSGLMGSGRTEIMRTIFGVDRKDSGEIYINGTQVKIKNPADAIKHGLGFVTEDRKTEGLVLDFSVRENIVLTSFDNITNGGLISTNKEEQYVDELVQKLTVKTASRETPARSLSGGNQQKVVIAKWIGMGTKILILDEPTRGVDIGAKREIYLLMNELTSMGVAIIMVSSELPEVLGMSDRIMVCYEGKITGELSTSDATQEKIMTLATGGQ